MEIDRRGLLGGAAALGLATMARGAVTGVPEAIAPKAIAADLAIVREAYGLLHPGLTRYLPPGGFDRLVDRAIAWGDRERSAGDVYLMLARLTAAVRCGHTHANPANQRGAVQRDLLGRADRLPLRTRWIDGRMVVTDPIESGLARGTEIRAVDGVAAARLLSAMLPLTRADGGNDGKRVAQLELHRGDRFAAFDMLRPLLFPTRGGGTALLDVRDPGGRERSVLVATAPEGRRGVPARESATFGWTFAIGDDGFGVLTMPDWALYQTKWDWRGFLTDAIDALNAAGARGLVIDIRENEGGIDAGDVLLAAMTARPIVPDDERRLVRFRETPPALRPALDTWDPSFHTLGANAVPVAGRAGWYDLNEDGDATIAPAATRLRCPVAVLVGPTCSSATFRFAQMLRLSGTGVLVGEETGGNLRGINGGRYFFVRLPGTGFEVDLPLVGYFPVRPQPDRGLRPDVTVRPHIGDIAAGRDVALMRAKAALRG